MATTDKIKRSRTPAKKINGNMILDAINALHKPGGVTFKEIQNYLREELGVNTNFMIFEVRRYVASLLEERMINEVQSTRKFKINPLKMGQRYFEKRAPRNLMEEYRKTRNTANNAENNVNQKTLESRKISVKISSRQTALAEVLENKKKTLTKKKVKQTPPSSDAKSRKADENLQKQKEKKTEKGRKKKKIND